MTPLPDGAGIAPAMQRSRAPDRPIVLVVQAEAVQAMALACLLEGAGFDVVTAPDAATAIRMAAATPVVAAVVDLEIQDGDGRPLLRQLRRSLPGLPVVVVTAFDPRVSQADLRGLGGPTARVAKPYDAADLLARLRVAIVSGTGVAG